MPLRQKNVEISDFEIPWFGFVFRVSVLRIFLSKSDTSSPHPHSQCYIGYTNHGEKPPQREQSKLSFTTFWVRHRWFLRIFWPFLRPSGSDARGTLEPRRQRHLRGGLGRQRPGALRHFLRVAPERVHEKLPDGWWPQKTSVELRVCGWSL